MMNILPEIQFDRQKTLVPVHLKVHAASTEMLWMFKIVNFQKFDFFGKKFESGQCVIGRFFDRFEFNEGLVT